MTTTNIPFPTQDSLLANGTWPSLPYIAFNYLGELTTNGVDMASFHEYIPLAHGSVIAAVDQGDPAKKRYALTGSPSVTESPPGNSYSTSFNLVDVDPLTGRATLRFEKVQ